MTTTKTHDGAHIQPAAASSAAVEETPWYDLIDDPEPPEDGMQQEDTILGVMSVLKTRYENVPGALWFSQSNLIYDSDIPGSVVAPDGCIVLGLTTDARVIKRIRRSYRIDEWGPSPAFVLEVASESTAARDLAEKREIYAQMGAQEYWRLDKTGEYYGEPVVGERLVDGEYVRFELHTEPNGDIWARSEALGLDFYYHAERDPLDAFSLRDSATGEWLNTLSEEIVVRQAAEARAQEAEARAQEAEARNQELQAELDRLRRQSEPPER